MKVSVIIPSYNHARYLSERIDSVLNQTYTDFEIIILDDCSTDNSREIIKDYVEKYPQIKTFFNEKNSGCPGVQWNKGVGLASGEFVWIAESDDLAEPGFLEKTVKVLDESPEAGLVFTDSRILNENNGAHYLASDRRKDFSNERLTSCFNTVEGKKYMKQIFFDNPIVNVSSALFRKSVFQEVGSADENMRFCSDWKLYFNISQGSEIRYIPEPLSTFRLHQNSGYQLHYRSNVFVREKLKILAMVIKGNGFSPVMIIRYLKSVCKTLMLRLIYLLRIEKIIGLELPLSPKRIKS